MSQIVFDVDRGGGVHEQCGLNHLFGIGNIGAVTMTKEYKAAPPFTLPWSADEAAFRVKDGVAAGSHA
jgi:hypothetical protein